MKISLAWIGDFLSLPKTMSVQMIADAVTLQTVEVEEVIPFGPDLDHIVIGHIDCVTLIEGSKNRLVLCDVGADSPLQIVCGAANIKAGIRVIVALPGAQISGFTVAVRKMGDIESQAVICAATEVGLETLFPDEGARDVTVLPTDLGALGMPVAQAFHWPDTVLDIDNKSLTNRPDLWGHYGMAREISAITGGELAALPAVPAIPPASHLIGDVDEEFCYRFTGALLELGDAGESPIWLKSRLARVGQRPINLYTDITNYIMFASGQPCHAYDADKLCLPLGVRKGRAGEELTLLDGTHVDVTGLPIVADQNGPVAAAGVMGGRDTAITQETRRVYFECACFQAPTVRRAADALGGLRTEASTRFEKQIDTQRIDQALGILAEITAKLDPGTRLVAYQSIDKKTTGAQPITYPVSYIQSRLGKADGHVLDKQTIKEALVKFHFDVTIEKEQFTATPPTWRATGDISGPHDILEEVARAIGFARFQERRPAITLKRTIRQSEPDIQRRVSEYLAFQNGMQQVFSYPWVGKLLDGLTHVPQKALMLNDPPSGEEAALRRSLVPNLVQVVSRNLPYMPEFGIFECGSVFFDAGENATDSPQEKLPHMPTYLGAALVGKDAQTIYYHLKGILEGMSRHCHLEPLTLGDTEPVQWMDAQSGLGLLCGEEVIGHFGLLSQKARRLGKIKRGHVAVVEIDLTRMKTLPARSNDYKALPQQEGTLKDITLIVSQDTQWQQVVEALRDLDPLVHDLRYIGIYQGKGVAQGYKSLTFRLCMQAEKRALKSEEANHIAERAKRILIEQIGAQEQT